MAAQALTEITKLWSTTASYAGLQRHEPNSSSNPGLLPARWSRDCLVQRIGQQRK